MPESYLQMLHGQGDDETSPAAAEHHEEEHYAPPRTLPQGVVDHQQAATWERRDVDFAGLFRLMYYLAALVVVCLALVVAIHAGMLSWLKAQDRLPSGVFAERQPPPEPRLFPNPDDARARPLQVPQTPMEYYQEQRKQENMRLAEAGLFDERSGLPVIPAAALEAVASRNGRPVPDGVAARRRGAAPSGDAHAGHGDHGDTHQEAEPTGAHASPVPPSGAAGAPGAGALGVPPGSPLRMAAPAPPSEHTGRRPRRPMPSDSSGGLMEEERLP